MNSSFSKGKNLLLEVENEYSRITKELNKLAPFLDNFINNNKTLIYVNPNINFNINLNSTSNSNFHSNSNFNQLKHIKISRRYTNQIFPNHSDKIGSNCHNINYREDSHSKKSDDKSKFAFLINNYKRRKKKHIFTPKANDNSKDCSLGHYGKNKNTEDIIKHEEMLLQTKIKNYSDILTKIHHLLDSEKKKNKTSERLNSFSNKISNYDYFNNSEICKKAYQIIKPYDDEKYLQAHQYYHSKANCNYLNRFKKPNLSLINSNLFEQIDSYIKSDPIMTFHSENLEKNLERFNIKLPGSKKRSQFKFSSPKKSLSPYIKIEI